MPNGRPRHLYINLEGRGGRARLHSVPREASALGQLFTDMAVFTLWAEGAVQLAWGEPFIERIFFGLGGPAPTKELDQLAKAIYSQHPKCLEWVYRYAEYPEHQYDVIYCELGADQCLYIAKQRGTNHGKHCIFIRPINSLDPDVFLISEVEDTVPTEKVVLEVTRLLAGTT